MFLRAVKSSRVDDGAHLACYTVSFRNLTLSSRPCNFLFFPNQPLLDTCWISLDPVPKNSHSTPVSSPISLFTASLLSALLFPFSYYKSDTRLRVIFTISNVYPHPDHNINPSTLLLTILSILLFFFVLLPAVVTLI